MRETLKSKRARIILTATLLVGANVASPAAAGAQQPADLGCANVVQAVAKKRGLDRSPGTASFACVGDQVVFTLRADSGRTQRVETRVQYTNNPKRKSSSDELSVNVPYSTAQITCGDYDRTIKSELETLVWGCLQYGEYDLSDGSTIWAREIDYEWTM